MKKLITSILALSLSSALAQPHPEELMHATYKLYNRSSTATCFLIHDEDRGDLHLVTAAHVLEKSKGEQCLLVLRQQDENGKWSRLDHPIAVREGETAIWTQHPDLDIAVLSIDPNLAPANTISINSLVTKAEFDNGFARMGDPAILFTYPARVESHSAGFPVGRTTMLSGFPLRPEKDEPSFVLDLSSYSGDSGGPVMIRTEQDHLRIIGLVIERIHDNETIDAREETRKVKHQLLLSRALYSSYILDTIELARKQNEPESASNEISEQQGS